MSLYARLIGAAVLLLALCAGVWKVYHTGYTAGVNEVQGQYQARALEAERQARAAEQAKVAAVNQVESRHAETKRRAAADAAAAQSELDQLRGAIASGGAVPQDAAAAGRADDAARVRYVLGQCANSITKLAEAADAVEAQLIGLQDYVRNVCAPARPP